MGTSHISFWYDKWIDVGFLCEMVPFVNIQDMLLTVSDVYYDGVLHFDNLMTLVPDVVHDLVNATPLVDNCDLDDVVKSMDS